MLIDTARGRPLDKDRRFVVALGLLMALSATTIDIVLPAIPSLAAQFGAPENAAQFVITAYLFGFTLGQIPIGLLADRYGRRIVVFSTLVVFVIAGLVAAASPSLLVLCLARFVQGLAGAVGGVIARAIVRDVGGQDGGAALMATMTAILGLAPLLAPLVGGALTDLFSWRSSLYTISIYGVLTFVAVVWFVPETHGRNNKTSAFDQLKRSASLLLANKKSLIGIALVCLPFTGYMAMLTTSATITIGEYGVTPFWFGVIFAIAAGAYTCGAALARRLLLRYTPTEILRIGICVLAVSVLALIFSMVLSPPPLWFLWAAIMIYIFGTAIVAPMATTIALQPLASSAGFGSAVIGTAQIGASAIGSVIGAVFYMGNENSMCAVMIFGAVASVLVFAGFGRSVLSS